MKSQPLRTSVIGSYPFPGWLEFSAQHLSSFGTADIAEMQDDAAQVAIQDQIAAGLDVITDGEQTRFDFNLSFYGFIEGIALEPASPRRFGPPAHDQRGKHEIVGELRAPRGLGAVEEFQRLKRLAATRANASKSPFPVPTRSAAAWRRMAQLQGPLRHHRGPAAHREQGDRRPRRGGRGGNLRR
jgi:5-methyltetrahydropteroyltriglutamate--homocysteine methyltransferase